MAKTKTLTPDSRLITEDNYHSYLRTEHGIKVQPHNGEWIGYYRIGDRCELILTAYCFERAIPVLTIPIRTYEDLVRAYQ